MAQGAQGEEEGEERMKGSSSYYFFIAESLAEIVTLILYLQYNSNISIFIPIYIYRVIS